MAWQSVPDDYQTINLDYRRINPRDTTGEENKSRINFVRGTTNSHGYPRFHIILKRAKFEITSFHIDIFQHRKSTDDYLNKDNEIRR